MALPEKVKLTGLYKITADSAVLNDVDKMVLDIQYKKRQRRVVIPWQEFTSEEELVNILDSVVQNLPPQKKIYNLTKKWRGDYSI